MENFYYLLSMMNLIIKVFNLILKCMNKKVLHRKYKVHVIGKRLLREDLILSLAYHNIRIEMTLKIVTFI